MQPITPEQKHEFWAHQQYQRAWAAALKKCKGLDDARDHVFCALYEALRGNPPPKPAAKRAKPPKKPPTPRKLVAGGTTPRPKQKDAAAAKFSGGTQNPTYIAARLNFAAPKSEWRKREPGEVARDMGLKLSRSDMRGFGAALRAVLKTKNTKSYLVPPVKK